MRSKAYDFAQMVREIEIPESGPTTVGHMMKLLWKMMDDVLEEKRDEFEALGLSYEESK